MQDDPRSWRVERNAIGIALLVLWLLLLVTSGAEWVALLMGLVLIALGVLMLVDRDGTMRSYQQSYDHFGISMDQRAIRWLAIVSAIGAAVAGLLVLWSIVARVCWACAPSCEGYRSRRVGSMASRRPSPNQL